MSITSIIDDQIRSDLSRWIDLVHDVGLAFFSDRQDTVDIARRCGISEATAYSALIGYRRLMECNL